MDTLHALNEVLASESEKIKNAINEHCSVVARCVDEDARHVIKSQWVCLNDIQATDNVAKKLEAVVEELKEKVFQWGYFVGKCYWSNIPHSEHNILGNTGRFIVTLA